ncbi:hypothetical protein [Nocardia tengchongensis]
MIALTAPIWAPIWLGTQLGGALLVTPDRSMISEQARTAIEEFLDGGSGLG